MPPSRSLPRSGDRRPGRTAEGRLGELPRDADALPALPEAFHEALDTGLEAAGLTLGAAARQAIDRHVRLLLAWNRAINLTSITDPAAIAVRHVLDSLAALPLLGPAGAAVDLVDIGSGGGFPGLPLAAARPATRATLVDSVAKKATFLEAAVEAAGLSDRVRVATSRAEALASGPDAARWSHVTARAVGSMDLLVELGLPLLRVGGRLIAWKRGDIASELAAAGRAASALGGGPPEVHEIGFRGLEGHVLVEVRKVAITPAGYPRDPARRERHPW